MSAETASARGTAGAAAAAKQLLVLASESPTRAALLRNAGLACLVEPAGIDEAELKRALRGARASTAKAAETLAALKAEKVSGRHGGAFVIGADQMLEYGGRWFDKPADLGEARAQLMALRGKAHKLVSAVAVVRDGTRLWHHVDRARLHMRAFSDAFLEVYLAAAGESGCRSVGGYRLESHGAQLFSRVEGDYFAILGLPLLPLLDFLRQHGAVPA